MNYEQFLKLLAVPFSHWKFNKPRKNGGSQLVLIADTYYMNNPLNDFLVMMDVKPYQPGEPRVFNQHTPASIFFELYQNGSIEPVVPVVNSTVKASF